MRHAGNKEVKNTHNALDCSFEFKVVPVNCFAALGRHTQVVRVFPNEGAYLRLVSAILMEISEEWGYGRLCFRIGPGKEVDFKF